MDKILLLSCSSRKRQSPGLLPAVERYDGPPFRLLRKFALNNPEQRPRTYIVSAEYGFIADDTFLPNYDRKMTIRRAEELRVGVTQELKEHLGVALNSDSEGDVFIHMGKIYLQAIQGLDKVMPQNYRIRTAQGNPGGKLSALYDWLYGEPPTSGVANHAKIRANPKIRGVEISLSVAQITSLVAEQLKSNSQDFKNFQAWYVCINGHRVSPKWLVGQLTGLPVSAFHSSEARRVLTQLGFEVGRA